MNSDRGLAEWLSGRTRQQLADLLSHRPDVLAAPGPASIAELALRLSDASSVAAAVIEQTLPGLQMLEAALVLGGHSPLTELEGFLHSGPDPQRHAELVRHWLARLGDSALAWVDNDDVVRTPDALAELLPNPLGLGPPLRSLLVGHSVDTLTRLLRSLDDPAPHGRRDEVIERVLSRLTDAGAVRALAATAPAEVAAELLVMAQSPAEEETEPWTYGPSVARRMAAVRWGRAVGLVFGGEWAYSAVMPAEVARALRGEQFRAPFRAEPPVLRTQILQPAQLASFASAAVSGFDDRVISLMDGLQRLPVPALKSGGLGTRELGKLAKSQGASERELRLALELCLDAGLIARTERGWQASDEATRWRGSAPSARMATLLECWLRLDRLPTDDRDENGKLMPALLRRWNSAAYEARLHLLDVLAGLAPGHAVQPDDLLEGCVFDRPFAYPPPPATGGFLACLTAEATLLGVIADGALTELGRTLLTGSGDDLLALLDIALPATSERAAFGTDLTVVVTGSPAAQLSRLLDLAADRESRGAATMWRFSPGSVRRAFDEGMAAEQLQQRLSAVATSELPQPLRYLIDDVGRQHGRAQVSPASSVLCSEDRALLAEIAHHRSLAKLGLVLLSDTVLAAAVDAPTLLAALRAAGYFPVLKDGAAAAVNRSFADVNPDLGADFTVDFEADVVPIGRMSSAAAPRLIEVEQLAERLLAGR